MKYRRLLGAIAAIILMFIPAVASAQAGTAGQGLEIGPPLVDIKVDPGQSKDIELRVRNVTTQTLVVKAQINDFVAAGETGQPKLLLNDDEQSPYSIKSWITDFPSLTLKPSEREVIKVTLHVPKDASPGGHYGVVRFTGTPPELEGTGVSLSASVGTLILANVSGKVTEQAKITELYTSQNNKKRSLFEYGPVGLTLRFNNSGNVHLQPTGTIKVTNTFGKTVTVFQLNSNKVNVLPQSIRRFDQTLDKKLLFGRYKVQADVVYGSDSKIISTSTTFWVIPYKLVAIALAILVALFFLIRYYNRLILKRAQKKQNNGSDKTPKKSKK